MNTYIYVVRHGEVHNPKGILYGRLPRFGLSAKGKKELALTGQFLKDKHLDAIYASPMLRARQSAKIIQQETEVKAFHISKHLLEAKTSFQGKLFKSLSPDQREVYLSPLRKPDDEDVPTIAKRMKEFALHIVKKHKGEHIVLVSHGDPIMSLKAIINNLPLDYTAVRNGPKVGPYLKHGEVTEVVVSDDIKLSHKSVFIPVVNE